MRNLHRVITSLSSASLSKTTSVPNGVVAPRLLSAAAGGGSGGDGGEGEWGKPAAGRVGNGGEGEWGKPAAGMFGNGGEGEWGKPAAGIFGGSQSDNVGWDSASPWSTGITKEQFGGAVAGRPFGDGSKSQSRTMADFGGGNNGDDDGSLKEFEEEMKRGKRFVDGWSSRFRETCELVKQVQEPGARGSYLKDSEKAEICRLHKEDPEVHTIEKLAKDFRILRQRVHAILFLKELEEKKEKLGRPLEECIERLLDSFPEFFQSHDQEFHVASISRKPEFEVMPEDWDGTPKDMDEVHFKISQKQEETLYREFLLKLDFVKKKVAGEVYGHKYSRRRPDDGWKFTVEKLGPRGKRGNGGAWRFVSLPNGSSRPLNEMEKLFLKRETPRRPHRIVVPYRES